MNILIIGGTRFVGYYLTWRLLAGGHRVTLFNRGILPDPFGDRVERLHGDRTTNDFRRRLADRTFDAVVDFAAYHGEDTTEAVEVLHGRVGHYILISSGQVYLVREGCPWPAREADYTGPLMVEPTNPEDRDDWLYGMGKRAAEDRLAGSWASQGFPSTRLRIPMVNGPRDYFRRIESYLWRILDGGPVILPDGGTQTCRHIYGPALARTIAGLLGSEATFGQAYNLCQEETPTLAELIVMLCEILGSEARLADVSADRLAAAGLQPVDISPFSGRWMSTLDPSRAREELGFRHDPLRSTLEETVTAFLAYPPEQPPDNYAHRPVELGIAGRAVAGGSG